MKERWLIIAMAVGIGFVFLRVNKVRADFAQGVYGMGDDPVNGRWGTKAQQAAEADIANIPLGNTMLGLVYNGRVR
jgi:hypothetical protein